MAPPTEHEAACVDDAVVLAARLLAAASGLESRAQRRRRRRLARMLSDDASRRFTLALADEVLRIHDVRRAGLRFRDVVAEGLPPFLGPVDRALLRAGAAAAGVVPQLVMPLVAARVRRETEAVLLPADEPGLHARVAEHAAKDQRVNVNLLGEAILGEDEARRRVADVVALLQRDHVDYVSVKISAICSQLDVLAFDASVARIVDRLRELYRAAKHFTPAKFVNLDMEEYRDLHLTVAAFVATLDEPEFLDLEAGIVLQAYLPDAYDVLRELCDWARARRARGGAGIKIRLVKGANLAMEHVDAEMHGWVPAPFATKAEVDANYKRLLDVVLDPAYADAVRVGVASHNLFEVAWALTLRGRHPTARLEVEMLEGMAPPQSAAVADAAGGLLLYGPATHEGELEPAVAYLARRLDENAAPENFLHALFSMTPGSPEFTVEEQRFRAAAAARHDPPSPPRRTQNRLVHRGPEVDGRAGAEAFANEPDTDFTSAANRQWIVQHLDAGAPSAWPEDAAPTIAEVDAAVARARDAASAWRDLGSGERGPVLRRVAEEMAADRGATIAAMAHTANKTVAEGDTEVSEAIDFARYYATTFPAYEGVDFEPYAVTVVASPWNFPYAIPAGGVLAALAAGGSVILKPSPKTRVVAARIVEQCRRGGVPDDVVQLLACDDDEAGRHLITHDAVDAVVLTGSWEAARRFRSWKPRLALHAETSGKNAMVVTATADLDAAIRDLIRSAFGNAGQKCSAASLGILEASVYDDERFLARLADAVRSLRVGAATDLDSTVGPLIAPAAGPLLRAFTQLDAGELWLVAPRQLDECTWTPGVKLGVAAGSWFHTAECFGPVLGLIRAESLDHAIELQNATPFGLTAGLQALDPAEIDHWTGRVKAGNLYVNRATTGAIVRRQPFGGWKRSSMGPGAKAGGPNYVASLGRFTDSPVDAARAPDYAAAWAEHFVPGHDPSALAAESNVFRYVPYDRPVIALMTQDAHDAALERCRLAARTSGVTLVLTRASGDEFAEMLSSVGPAKVRVIGRAPDEIYAACDDAGVAIDDAPVTAVGRVELLHWVREQTVSQTQHRYGNVRRPK